MKSLLHENTVRLIGWNTDLRLLVEEYADLGDVSNVIYDDGTTME